MIKKMIPVRCREKLITIITKLGIGCPVRSYSQEGEDMILKMIFRNHKKGFYVDVGAHHPKRFSNTCLFYKQKWRGINIDAMPGSMQIFKRFRPRDINLEMAISNKKETLKYHVFNEPAINTFSREFAQEKEGQKNYRVLYKKDIQTYTLKEVLNEYLPENQMIDFLSIDVEGLDFQVLKSNDWDQYRPSVILIETIGSSLENVMCSEIYNFLSDKGYVLFAKTVNTSIFKLASFLV